jgi:hypothetical protein
MDTAMCKLCKYLVALVVKFKWIIHFYNCLSCTLLPLNQYPSIFFYQTVVSN